MNCADWEQQIASELETTELEQHLAACGGCREFAGELEKNRAALCEFSVHPAMLSNVRQRVLGEIQAKKRRAMAWAWSAAAAMACAAILCVLYVAPRFEIPVGPKAILADMHPPKIEWTPRVVHTASSGRSFAQARPVRQTEPIVAVKMLTDDPNVIIIWLIDQKGDSL